MHPILAAPRRIGLYLLLFLQGGGLLAELLVQSLGAERYLAWLLAVPLLLAHGFSCLASWYLCRVLPLRETQLERLLVTQGTAGAMASGVFLGLAWLWAGILDSALGPNIDGLSASRLLIEGRTVLFVFALWVFFLVVAVHYLLIAVDASRRAESRAYELQMLAREAELKALKLQIDPHFLFNCLNTIASLTVSAPEQARRMSQRLADFLRQSLRLGGHRSISLRQEMDLAASYLDIEQVRFGERLRPVLDLDPTCEDGEVLPLLLQPLVENAVRHGIAHLLDGGEVRISSRCRQGRLVLTVHNPCDEDRPLSDGEGIGLSNVTRRLKACYGPAARLRTETTETSFEVEIEMPMQLAAGEQRAEIR